MPTPQNQSPNKKTSGGQPSKTSAARNPSAKTKTAPAAPVSKKKKKKKKGHGRTVLTVLMVVLILAAAGFIYYLGRTVYVYYKEATTDTGGSNEQASPIVYETTPVAQSEKVGYYLVGLLGADGNADETELLSMVCFDKKQKTVRILQVPQDTYVGDSDVFKVKTVSQVFANPQDYDWCESCRRRVYAPEKAEDGTHTVCGRALTKKTGSSTVNLAEVFNLQYGLPVDGYYLFEQDTFVKLIDLVGGVDVELAFDVRVDDTTYAKGLRTIDGAAALSYVMAKDGTIASDIDRFSRFQQVSVSILQRLYRMSDNEMTADVFQPLMMSSTPLRIAVGDTYSDIVTLVRALSKVPFEEMTAYVLPGSSATSEGVTYYSVHRQELLSLLNEQFNPYGDPLSEGDLQLTELSSGGAKADLKETKLSAWVVEQSGAAVTTAEEGTQTTQAAV